MKTSFEKKTNGLVALSVKIEKEELEKYIEEVFIKEKEKLQIKGFRIGQAPEEIAKDFISQEKIFNEAAEKAVKDSLKKVGEENGWILIDSPKVKFEEDKEGLSFKAELTLFPEVELPDYKIIAKRANEEVKEKIKYYAQSIKSFSPNFILAAGWYYIIPKDILRIPDLGCGGIHASLLPRYRGGAPLSWAIINGERQTGVSLFYFAGGVDTGDIIGQKKISITERDTIQTVYKKAAKTALRLIEKYIPLIELFLRN